MKNVKLDIQRFSHTNSTTNYEFPQFVGTDKPAWLTDVNGFASAADTAIKAAKDRADSAYTLAGTAEGKADLAQGDATSALNSAGTANTNIGTMANLETTDKTSLVNAINENKRNIDNFNLTTYETASNVATTDGTIDTPSINLKTAKNSDGSLAKIYGTVHISSIGSTQTLSFSTSLRPESSIYIDGVVLYQQYYALGIVETAMTGLTLGTDGTVSIDIPRINSNDTDVLVNIIPVLLWIKDFGDTPTPTP